MLIISVSYTGWLNDPLMIFLTPPLSPLSDSSEGNIHSFKCFKLKLEGNTIKKYLKINLEYNNILIDE